MNYERASLGLGIMSIGLGLTELVAAKRIASSLGVTDHERLIRGFGVRELIAGLGLIDAPAHSIRVWNRVAGDAVDLAMLGVATRRGSLDAAKAGAIAFVIAATILDVVVARGLDRTRARAFPKVAV